MILYVIAWLIVFAECESMWLLVISKVIALTYIIVIGRIKRWYE